MIHHNFTRDKREKFKNHCSLASRTCRLIIAYSVHFYPMSNVKKRLQRFTMRAKGGMDILRSVPQLVKDFSDFKSKADATSHEQASIDAFPPFEDILHPDGPVHHLLLENGETMEDEALDLAEVISAAEIMDRKFNLSTFPLRSETRLFIDDYASKDIHDVLDRLDRKIAQRFNPVISAIRRVPTEILQEIFLFTVTPQYEGHCFEWMKLRELPWEISQVCRVWRNISFATPALWRQVPTVDLQRSRKNEEIYLQILGEVLMRSRGTSIDLHIRGIWATNFSHPALRLLIQSCERWRKIKIDAGPEIMPYLSQVKGRLASLQALILILSVDPLSSRTYSESTSDNFLIAPQLKDVYLETPTWLRLLLPSHQLLYYWQDCGHILQAPSIIEVSSKLTTLKLCDISAGGVMPPVALTELTSLKIVFEPSTPHDWFLDSLTLPSLEDLQVESYLGNLILSATALITRSGSVSRIQTLMLKANPNQPGQLVDLLKKVPLLNHLSVRLPPAMDLQAMAFSRGCCPVLVPNLQSCYFCTLMEDIPPETIQALNLLASSQCDITGPVPIDHNGIGSRQLETLLVYLPNYSSSERCRHNLQGWTDSGISNDLKSWNHRLTTELPELFHGAVSRRRKYDFMWKDRVIGILRNIENIRIENASDIVMSGIHPTIFRLSYWFPEDNSHYRFCKRAKAILEKWDPVFRDGAENLRWAVKFNCVISLSKNDALRMSETATDLVCGLDLPRVAAPHTFQRRL